MIVSSTPESPPIETILLEELTSCPEKDNLTLAPEVATKFPNTPIQGKIRNPFKSLEVPSLIIVNVSDSLSYPNSPDSVGESL